MQPPPEATTPVVASFFARGRKSQRRRSMQGAMKKTARPARSRTLRRRRERARGKKQKRAARDSGSNRGDAPTPSYVLSFNFDSPDTPFDPEDHACECPVCDFMVEHGIVEGQPIPAHLMESLGEVMRRANRFVA